MVTVKQLKAIVLYVFFFPFAVLGVDTKVLCMLGEHATTDLHPKVLCMLGKHATSDLYPKPDLCKCSEQCVCYVIYMLISEYLKIQNMGW